MDLAFFCTRVTKMPAKMQRYKVPCSHVQPVVTVVTVVVHLVHTHTCSVGSVCSRAGHEHHRDAESQVERRRLPSWSIRIEHPGPLILTEVTWCHLYPPTNIFWSKGFLLYAQHLSMSEFVWKNSVDVWAIQLQMMKKTRKRKRRRGPRLLLPCVNECILQRSCRKIAELA